MRNSLTRAQEFIHESVGFTPGALQKPILLTDQRFVLLTGGIRAGKSTLATKFLWSRKDWEGNKEGKKQRFALLAADYRRTSAEFEYLTEDARRLGLLQDATKRVDPGQIQLHDGTVIETLTANDPTTIAMYAYDGIIICEAAQVGVETWYRAQERVAERRGWVLAEGTLEGSLGWYAKLHEVWQTGNNEHGSYSLPSWANTAVFPGGRRDPEILRLEATMPEEMFLERIAGQPCPPKGLVYREFRPDVHIREVEWAGEETPVFIWEDPGYGTGSAHAIEVAQMVHGQVQVFDEIYEQGLVTADIINICMKREWWKSPKQLVCDPHYKDQHHSMSSVAEVWLKETRLVAGGEKVAILPGIERVKSFLKVDALTGQPGIVFSPRCKGLLSEAGAAPYPFLGSHQGEVCAYRWKLDRDGNVVGETPDDKYNHAWKALSYGLVYKFGYAGMLSPQVTKVYRNWSQEERYVGRIEAIRRKKARAAGGWGRIAALR